MLPALIVVSELESHLAVKETLFEVELSDIEVGEDAVGGALEEVVVVVEDVAVLN